MKSKYCVFHGCLAQGDPLDATCEVYYLTSKLKAYAIRKGSGIDLFWKASQEWHHYYCWSTLAQFKNDTRFLVENIKEAIVRFLEGEEVLPVVCGKHVWRGNYEV